MASTSSLTHCRDDDTDKVSVLCYCNCLLRVIRGQNRRSVEKIYVSWSQWRMDSHHVFEGVLWKWTDLFHEPVSVY
jgi:hypothetical protein